MDRRTPRNPESLKRYFIDVAYTIENNSPIIHIFSRNEKLEPVHDVFYGFSPYCYITKEALKILKKEHFKFKSLISGFRSSYSSLYKVEVNTPREIAELKSILKKERSYKAVQEGDIEYKIRYIINKGIKTGYFVKNKQPIPEYFTVTPRIWFIDIETFAREVETSKALDPIISISIFDNYTNSYYVLSSRKFPSINLVEVLNSQPKNLVTNFLENEIELLVEFNRLIDELNPDFLASFTKYDLKYLIRRIARKNLKCKLARIGEAKITGRDEIKIPGRGFIDLQFAYRILLGKMLKWESLDAIAQRELGYGKLKITSVYDTWLSNPEFVIKYNLRDVELIKEIDKKRGLMEYFLALKNFVGCPIEYAFTSNSRADILYLRKCYNKFILPNRRVLPGRFKGWSYKGAIVFEPIPGIYDYVAVLDFTAQYPSIIRTWNISFETLHPSGNLIIDEEHRFKSRPKGITVEIIEEFLELRNQLKAKMKNARKNSDTYHKLKAQERAIKTCLESVYGLYGFKGKPGSKFSKAFRLFNPVIAEAIPLAARKLRTLSPSRIRDWIRDNRTKKDPVTGKRVQCEVTPESITMWLKRHPDVKATLEREIIEKEDKITISETIFENHAFLEIPSVKRWVTILRANKVKERSIQNFLYRLKYICTGQLTKQGDRIEDYPLKHPDRLTKEDVVHYIAEREKRGLLTRPFRIVARNFFRLGRGLDISDMVSGMGEHEGLYSDLYVSKQKIYEILDYLKSLNKTAYLASKFAYKTGSRLTATLSASIENVNFQEHTITLFEKSSRRREKRKLVKLIPPDLWEELDLKNKKGKIFEIEERELRKLVRTALKAIVPEIEKRIFMPFHFWRHMFAQHMLRASGWNYGLVAALGHWDPSTLRRYYGEPPQSVIRSFGLETLPKI